MKRISLFVLFIIFAVFPVMRAQVYTVHAVDDGTNKSLSGSQLRFDMTAATLPFHCHCITRKTGKDGLVHLPQAGKLPNIDDIYSLPIAYVTVADLQPKVFPGEGTKRFRRRTLSQTIQWIVAGP